MRPPVGYQERWKEGPKPEGYFFRDTFQGSKGSKVGRFGRTLGRHGGKALSYPDQTLECLGTGGLPPAAE
eukprot:9394713-Alexandrium_andersonii.AAC.1